MHSTRTNRWNNDVSTKDTIRDLRRLARRYAGDPSVQFAADQALSVLGPGATQREQACAIFDWVRRTVRFVEDETLLYQELGVVPEELDKELLIVPPVLLRMPVPMGDCDDFSLLIPVYHMLWSLQYPTLPVVLRWYKMPSTMRLSINSNVASAY